MNNEEIITEIERLSVKIGAFSPQDKAAIRDLCKASGLNVVFRGRCPNCYDDAVHMLRRHYGVTSARPMNQEARCGYRCIVSPCRVRVNGEVFQVSGLTPCREIERFRAVAGDETFSQFFQEAKTE